MIATVTFNPSLDRLLEVDGLSADDANRVRLERHYAAGKGIDASRVIAELGGATKAFGLVGGNDGREVELRLAGAGVPSDFVFVSGETRVNILLYDRAVRKQYIINARGPAVSPADFDSVLMKVRAAKPQAVIASGSLPEGLPVNSYARLIDSLRGTPVFVDADGEALAAAVASRPWGIKPNRHEASRLLGRQVETATEAVAAAQELSAKGIEHVLVSLGRDGAVLVHGGQAWLGHPPKVETVSAVGAGDAMVATYTLRVFEGTTAPLAFQWALAAGAAVALTPGTELCHRADVERLFPEAKVESV